MSESITVAVECFELALAGSGCVILWRFVLSPHARARRRPSPLAEWQVTSGGVIRFLFYVFAGLIGLGILASTLSAPLGLRGDAVTVFNGAAAQLGMLAGILLYRATYERPIAPMFVPDASLSPEEAAIPTPPLLTPAPQPNVFVAGLVTFLVTLPVLMGAAKAWELFLRLFDLPAQKQDLVEMFVRAESPWLLGTMVILAVIIAPITEELVFRAGLFRFLRTRAPRWRALLLPAIVFASLHVNWSTLEGIASFVPLIVLAVGFSLAYERTGRIGTAIVAHALFNLNTIVMIFAGVGVGP